MALHRASLQQRVRTWWDEKSVHPIVLPIVWGVLSVLLLIGLAITVPPIIQDILEPDEPEIVQTPSPTPTEEQTLPPVLIVPSPQATQEPEPVEELPPAGPEPQDVPQPFVPQSPPVPVQPFVPQPQVTLPPVIPVPPVQPLPSLPPILEPVVPPILQPVVEDPLGSVEDAAEEVLEGGGNLVDETVDTAKDVVDTILP